MEKIHPHFCGYAIYDDIKPPFDSSSMVYFRKRLTSEVMGEITEMILSKNKQYSFNDNDNSDGSNSGTMIVDATCAPSNIKYPQDASLLNQARESSEKLIDYLPECL